MLQDLEAVKQIIQTFGLSAIFVFFFIAVRKMWPALVSGSRQAGDLTRWVATQYLQQIAERVQVETEIDVKLGLLAVGIDKYLAELTGYEKRSSERITEIRKDFTDQLRNIEFVLSDKVFSELHELTELFEKHKDDFDDVNHECLQKKNQPPPAAAYKIGTEEFRKRRLSAANLTP
jgi:hypothetical protein